MWPYQVSNSKLDSAVYSRNQSTLSPQHKLMVGQFLPAKALSHGDSVPASSKLYPSPMLFNRLRNTHPFISTPCLLPSQTLEGTANYCTSFQCRSFLPQTKKRLKGTEILRSTWLLLLLLLLSLLLTLYNITVQSSTAYLFSYSCSQPLYPRPLMEVEGCLTTRFHSYYVQAIINFIISLQGSIISTLEQDQTEKLTKSKISPKA